MTTFEGTPSDELPGVLNTGRGDVTTVFASLSARDPDGRDAEYIRWHTLDHRPEQHRLAGMRGSQRLVSTPACRSARAASTPAYDATDHVMTYFFADPSVFDPFRALGGALAAADRMPLRLPSVEIDAYSVTGKVAAPRVGVGADVIPWRPAIGVYLLIEQGPSEPEPACGAELVEVDGVAGAWWATAGSGDGLVSWGVRAATTDGAKRVTYCFLDDDPIAVAERLAPVLERRWADRAVSPLLAAPFLEVVPHDWDRYLP